MIVRILSEGQYEIENGTVAELHALDEELVRTIGAGDEAGFQKAFDELLAKVRDQGRELDDASLEGSDLILPPSDTSFEEARHEFSAEGIIPD
jgi:hypothetical protein